MVGGGRWGDRLCDRMSAGTMSQRNVQIVSAFFAAAGDVGEAAEAFLAEDAEFVPFTRLAGQGPGVRRASSQQITEIADQFAKTRSGQSSFARLEITRSPRFDARPGAPEARCRSPIASPRCSPCVREDRAHPVVSLIHEALEAVGRHSCGSGPPNP